MLVQHSTLTWAAPVVGLVLAAAGWMLLGGPARALAPIDQIEQQVLGIRAPRPGLPVRTDVATAIAQPLFSPDVGKVSLRLDGLSHSPRRAAALLSINGGATQWVPVGATVSGVTLVAVTSRSAIVDTAIGRRDIRLGETLGEAPASSALPGSAPDEGPPAGTKLFPPASAPNG